MASEKRELSAGARLAVDFGPLLLFFVANGYAPVADGERIFIATAVFMAAMAAAMLFSKLRTGKISTLLWFNGIVVAIFGGLTLALHDELFIKIKPTLLYGLFASLLFYALATGKPLMKSVLGEAYPPLTERGWFLMTRNWAVFFVAMAVVNESVWRSVPTDDWVWFKTWIVFPLSMVFAVAQAPILSKHSAEDPPLRQGGDDSRGHA